MNFASATSTAPSTEPPMTMDQLQQRIRQVCERQAEWRATNWHNTNGYSRTSTPREPTRPSSSILLLSIQDELQSAIAALWDTDADGRILNQCPHCHLPAWACTNDDHIPIPNDLRIKDWTPGIEWTDEKGQYHRIEDGYLKECGLDTVDYRGPQGDCAYRVGGMATQVSRGMSVGILQFKLIRRNINPETMRRVREGGDG